MGKQKLERPSGWETQTACLRSVKKENGGCPTREMGEIQSEKSEVELGK
jgi:hypothetical protein